MYVTIRGTTTDAEAALRTLEMKLEGPLMGKAVAEFMTPVVQSSTATRFANEGDAAVGAWEPLSEYTKERRLKMGFGSGPINVRTGEMRESVTDAAYFGVTAAGAGSARVTYPEVPPGGELANKIRTAQSGKDEDGNVTPPRPILSFTEGDAEQLLVRMAAWLTESF